MDSRLIFSLLKGTLTIILAGGQGERLYPLTRDRAKPAVPFGGIYRIIDFTLSNCINSGLRKIYVLTQYKSDSLVRHIKMGWDIFESELGEFIYIIPPQFRSTDRWYSGTADAIYQNIYSLERARPERVLILSGDHVYKMDYSQMIEFHEENQADLTIAGIEVPKEEAVRLGVMEIDKNSRVIGFEEKPANPKPLPDQPDTAFISMGVYIFKTEALVRATVEDSKRDSEHDFGRNIIPAMVPKKRVFAYSFKDENKKETKYWKDIGLIETYWEANMDLVSVSPLFNLYDQDWPVRTYQRQLPPVKTVFADGERTGIVLNSIISGGCIISGGRVEKSVLSPRVRVHSFSYVSESILMDDVNVGRYSKVRRAIIDKRVNIPDGIEIGYDLEKDKERFTVSDKGIVVIPKEMKLESWEQ